ncbi:MAG TPA: zinc ribbon domain-containing protein [Candidatus Saccharimonadales bacterium]|nr:zinc ribbon domain-containing protein [Candidatus Saccharimonadales bacterium]
MAEVISILSNFAVSAILLFYILVVWLGLIVWTSVDVFHRTDNWFYRFLAIILVGVGSIFGFVLYLLLRPPTTAEDRHLHELEEKLLENQARSFICPKCSDLVREDFLFCPTCGFALKRECPSCRRGLEVVWSQCPFCGFKVGPQQLPEVVEVAPKKNGSLFRMPFLFRSNSVTPVEVKRGRGRPRKPIAAEPIVKRPRGRPRKDATLN